MDWLNTIVTVMSVAQRAKEWIDIGLPIAVELQKENPKIIPIMEQVGGLLFPKLRDKIHIVAAAADALFDPNGVRWLQASLNTLIAAGLTVDGQYGPKTRAAVERFQGMNQPASGPVDGWAGAKTQAVIAAKLQSVVQKPAAA